MATTAMNLSVPAPADDSMEMSSPGRIDFDEDIDFDDYEPPDTAEQVTDNDRMMDDGEQARPATATDDVMEDDVQQVQQTTMQEAEMEDSPSHAQPLEDEELIDYTDDELPDEVVPDVQAADIVAEQPPLVALANDVDSDEEVVRVPNEDVVEHPPQVDVTETPVAGPDPVTESSSTGDTHTLLQTETAKDATAATGDIEGAAHEGLNNEAAEVHIEAGLDEQPAAADVDEQCPVISVDTTLEASAEGPATPTDTGLHAMTVRFHDFHFPLFKSRIQPDGLLKNDNLASLSLGELIQNCRQRLAIKTGKTLSEDQDLVLGFDQLGLILVEDSRAAFESSLEEVLDVYLQLHRNDEIENIPPFSLNLSLQLKFTSSVSILKQAAAGGSGMSSFALHHAEGEEEVGEYDGYTDEQHGNEEHEDFDEQQYQPEEAADGQAYEQTAPFEGSNPEEQQADTNDLGGDYEDQQFGYTEHEGYYDGDEEYYQENLDQGQLHEDHIKAAQGEDLHHPEYAGDTQKAADGAHEVSEEQDLAQAEAAKTTQAPVEEEKSVSATTSITFQGDEDQHTAGKYNEKELIDWDDDSDLTSDPLDQTATSTGDDFNFDAEGDAAHDTQVVDSHEQDDINLQHDLTHVAEEQARQLTTEPEDQESAAQHLDDEDYLGDFDETYQTGENEGVHGEQPNDGSDPQDEAREQEYNESDDNAAQLENFKHADDPPAEDDDRFQTAYELFDEADADGHGPQPDAPGQAGDQVKPSTPPGDHAKVEDDDFIDFGDDEELVPTKASKPQTSATSSRTPLAKRSYEDLAGDDEIDFDSPEPKKARAS